jgi:transcriptional regulator with XRE-family HTH domain
MSGLQKLLGASVRRLRTERGLTQAQLAAGVERSGDMVSRIERGDTAPSFETLEKLCECLNVAPSELFGGVVSQDKSRTSVLREILELTAGMSARELEWFRLLLDMLRNKPD